MALTPEQQQEIELTEAREKGRREHELLLEQRRARLEAVKMAKEILIENSKYKTVDEKDFTSQDVVNFANTLTTFVVS